MRGVGLFLRLGMGGCLMSERTYFVVFPMSPWKNMENFLEGKGVALPPLFISIKPR